MKSSLVIYSTLYKRGSMSAYKDPQLKIDMQQKERT